jgi:hypothetical protein
MNFKGFFIILKLYKLKGLFLIKAKKLLIIRVF